MGRRGFLLIAWNGCGMCKGQRKLLLMVKLGGLVQDELFAKYNHCSRCKHRQCNPDDSEFRKKYLTQVYFLDGMRLNGMFCSKWERKKNGK